MRYKTSALSSVMATTQDKVEKSGHFRGAFSWKRGGKQELFALLPLFTMTQLNSHLQDIY